MERFTQLDRIFSFFPLFAALAMIVAILVIAYFFWQSRKIGRPEDNYALTKKYLEEARAERKRPRHEQDLEKMATLKTKSREHLYLAVENKQPGNWTSHEYREFLSAIDNA